MFLKSIKRAVHSRPLDGFFACATLPLKIGPDLVETAFVRPLNAELSVSGLGRVTDHSVTCDETREPNQLVLTLSLISDAPDALARVAALLESLDAPVGSTIGNGECPDMLRFGKSHGLGLYLSHRDADDDGHLGVVEACTDALAGAGLYQGSTRLADRTALYFYGDSFNRMRSAITYVMSHDPRCRNAYARRLN